MIFSSGSATLRVIAFEPFGYSCHLLSLIKSQSQVIIITCLTKALLPLFNMRQHIKKYSLITLGLVFVILGVVGAVLPILPTTPFLILALSCFAKSSPRFHQALLNNRFVGTPLKQWEESRSLTRRTKVKAAALIILTFSLSIFILQGKLPVQLGLSSLGGVLLFFIWRLKETEQVEAKI